MPPAHYTYVETCAIKLQAHGVSADVNARDLLLCSYYNYWEERCHSVTLHSLLLHGWVAKPQETDLLQFCHPIRVPHSGSQNSLKWTILWQMYVKADCMARCLMARRQKIPEIKIKRSRSTILFVNGLWRFKKCRTELNKSAPAVTDTCQLFEFQRQS